jgi:GT2 family glycosyltransferase
MISNLRVPVLNRYDLLQRLLDSIDYPVRHVFIIDNGDGPSEVIDLPDTVTEVTYSPLPNNLGVAGSWNLGIKALPYDEKWLIVSNDAYFLPGNLESFSEAGTNEIVLSSNFPFWQAFSIGEEVIRTVGLWDERLYPAYFEDDDYKRRSEYYGIPIRKGPETGHDNSSTIKSDGRFKARNEKTFLSNSQYYSGKVAAEDYSEGGWSISRRRKNSWTRQNVE